MTTTTTTTIIIIIIIIINKTMLNVLYTLKYSGHSMRLKEWDQGGSVHKLYVWRNAPLYGTLHYLRTVIHIRSFQNLPPRI
jgi:hypothetical protein